MSLEKAYRRDMKIEKRRKVKKNYIPREKARATIHHKEELDYKEAIRNKIIDEAYEELDE